MRKSLQKTALLWHTVRHLKPVQITGRVWYRLYRPTPDVSPAPRMQQLSGQWIAPACRRPILTGPENFSLLNRNGDLSRGWDDPSVEKLWRYNLHYFDDLNAVSAAQRTQWHSALVKRWIMENPSGKGTGWEPYPTSLRIVNWVKWTLAGNILPPEAIHSLAVQTRWLRKRLEYHLLGNHLFANAKALVFSGCFFDGTEAQGWLDLGLEILRKQVPEQVLADGGHFELSPMYHAFALEDMLDLINLHRVAKRRVPDLWIDKIAPMREWLAAMSHPDGEIAFFNDAAVDIAPSLAILEEYAQRLTGIPSPAPASGCRHLRESGYVRVQNERAVLLVDMARIGADYLPGHAHADTLSFELSVDGRRLLVNSGTSIYGTGPERLRQRGTAAHNTVVVANENSSEVWSGFRVARRARPFELVIEPSQETTTLGCSHDGYERLAGRPVHRRTIKVRRTALVVNDRITDGRHRAEARFHFHPDWSLTAAADYTSGAARLKDGRSVTWQIKAGRGRLDGSTYHPEFGLSIPNRCLAVELVGGQSVVAFSW